MINAIYFGAFALIAGLWWAAMLDEDAEHLPIYLLVPPVVLVIGGAVFVIVGFVLLGISYV